MPHHWVTGGNSRKISKPTRCILEHFTLVPKSRQHVNQGISKQVRQMAGLGQNIVVMRNTHHNNVCPQGLPQVVDKLNGVPLNIIPGRQDHFMGFKQIIPSGPHRVLLRTRDGMCWNPIARQLPP